MVGKRFSGPDTAYPHLQHNTTREHTHQGANLVRGRGCTSPFLSPSSSRPHRPRKSPAYSSQNPFRSWKTNERSLSREGLAALLLRRENAPAKMQGRKGPAETTACPPRCTSDTLCRKCQAAPGTEPLSRARTRQEPWFDPPREEETAPDSSGCLPSSKTDQRDAPDASPAATPRPRRAAARPRRLRLFNPGSLLPLDAAKRET